MQLETLIFEVEWKLIFLYFLLVGFLIRNFLLNQKEIFTFKEDNILKLWRMDEPGPIISTHSKKSMLKVIKNLTGQK